MLGKPEDQSSPEWCYDISLDTILLASLCFATGSFSSHREVFDRTRAKRPYSPPTPLNFATPHKFFLPGRGVSMVSINSTYIPFLGLAVTSSPLLGHISLLVLG